MFTQDPVSNRKNCGIVCFGETLSVRTLCDAYHKERASKSVKSWTNLSYGRVNFDKNNGLTS